MTGIMETKKVDEPDGDGAVNSFEIAHQVDRLMRRIEAGLHGKAVVIDTDRVGPFGGMVLLTLAEMEAAPVHRLVGRMGRDKSQMTRAIKTLEAKGMIARHACSDDGRVSLLSLTAKGRSFVQDIGVILSGVIDDILEPLTPQERQSLLQVLKKL